MKPIRYRKKKPKKEVKTLDRVLIILSIFLFSFITATVIIYTVKDWQYDTLITMVLSGGGIEVVSTALITIFKGRNKNEYDNPNDISDRDFD